jgi:tripartite ATP-independent transporter DctM subunit
MAAFFYGGVIVIKVSRQPSLAPYSPNASRDDKRRALWVTWPVWLIAVLMIGGLYGGYFTPTEAASVGLVLIVLISLARRRLGWEAAKRALVQSAETSGMIFLIILGADVFNAFLGLSQFPSLVAEWVGSSGLPPYAVLVLVLVFYIVLGGVMDEIAMLLLTLPVVFPMLMALDFGLSPDEAAIWFGILMLMVVGIGVVAPPIGLNVIVVSSLSPDVPITRIYRRVMPFLAADCAQIALIALFPAIPLFLVRLLA